MKLAWDADNISLSLCTAHLGEFFTFFTKLNLCNNYSQTRGDFKSIGLSYAPVHRPIFDIHTGVYSELSLKVLILTLNDVATHLLKANCLKWVLRLKRYSSRDEFHLGVWSFGFWCLYDPGVKFVNPGTISSRSSAPGQNFIPG